MEPIIKSLLDTDLYKFTMMQAVLHQFSGVEVEYKFINRDKARPTIGYQSEFMEQLNHLCNLRFTEEELEYLSKLKFLKPDFISFLRLFYFDKAHVRVKTEGSQLVIRIKGPWLHTILYETFILSILTELETRDRFGLMQKGLDIEMPMGDLNTLRANTKIKWLKENAPTNFRLIEMGTRRRASFEIQKTNLLKLKESVPELLFGTSNVLLAKELDLRPVGTMAHEYISACQQLGPKLMYSQQYAFDTWAREYRGDLGIALSDTVGYGAFFKDFDLYFSKLYDGARQDSGDPYEWGDRLIWHYEKMDIDPMTKVAVFSDSLDFHKAVDIAEYFKNRIKTSFGIGTYISNNLTDEAKYKAPNFVIKMVSCNGKPVAKVSDTPTKAICEDTEYFHYLCKVFDIKLHYES